MKKILVIMMMVLLCSTSVMAQNRKGKAKNRKAKTERAMTEFEKRQKKEYLAYLLYNCQKEYSEGDDWMANCYKNWYEEAKRKNYYVKFENPKLSDRERTERKKKGLDPYPGVRFYMDGYVIEVHFDHDGKADLVTSNFKGVYGYDGYNEVENKNMRYDSNKHKSVKDKLFNEINELSGYNAKVSKRKKELDGFVSQHKIETTKPVAEKKREQTNRPLSETSQANRRFYQEHKADYSAYNHLVYPQKKESKLRLKSEQEKPKTPVYSTRIVGSTD